MDERVHGSAAGIQLPAGRTPWMMCPMKQVLPSVNLSAWIKRTSFLVEHENDPRVENPQPSQRKRQKIMGEDPQSLENHGFPQISQLVLHSRNPLESPDSSGLFLFSATFWGSLFFSFKSDPDPDPYGNFSGLGRTINCRRGRVPSLPPPAAGPRWSHGRRCPG